MIVVRRGITRTVWLVGRWAVKVPSLRRYGRGLGGLLWSVTRGIQANLAEAEWSRNCDPDDPICRVRWSFAGIVNVYPRCEPFPVLADGETPAIPYPPIDWPLGDEKADNYGLLAGRPVRIDYDTSYNGCPHDHARRV